MISYNSGQNSSNPLQSQNGVMRTFDFDPSNDSIIYGAGSNLYEPLRFWKSTNKGNTWSSLSLGGNAYFASVKVNPLAVNEIFCITRDTVYKSIDHGDSFTGISPNPGGDRNTYIDDVSGTLYLTSFNGLYKSTNGGHNFSLLNNYNCNVLLIDPDDHNVLYLGVYYSGLYKSTNAGGNWIKYFDAFDSSFSVTGIIKYKNDGDTIYASNDHNVYKIWQQLVLIKNSSSESPVQYLISQNYPNPFNPNTKINYDIRTEGHVKIRVYDILGNELSTLVDKRLPSGSFEIEYDGSNFSSGVYFYTFEVDGMMIDRKRMVLLK
ncbi:MAG: T9SS type A sorting domain-containing protein [Ignavibacteria bacterium]|nr:T9SS type A sorting domain-containing protein [Ignavibacteria bacterium]